MGSQDKSYIFAQLQSQILRLQGFKPASNSAVDFGIPTLNEAFPNKIFPTGAVHEFLTCTREDLAATTGFISSMLSMLMKDNGIAMWISATTSVFPPSLPAYGIQPDRIIFVDVRNKKDLAWAMEEALKCESLTSVVCETAELSFLTSRRLQLAVEQSHTTGFVIRSGARNAGTTACVSRWMISSLPSISIDQLPGLGYPTWKVELLRMRNGKPGSWELMWKDGKFSAVSGIQEYTSDLQRKAG